MRQPSCSPLFPSCWVSYTTEETCSCLHAKTILPFNLWLTSFCTSSCLHMQGCMRKCKARRGTMHSVTSPAAKQKSLGVTCHVQRNLQSWSLCWGLRLKAFLWKFMSRQLWSHPPLYGSRRQRYPRNYEGIQSITHLQSTLSVHICTCNPFSVCLCTPLSMCSS